MGRGGAGRRDPATRVAPVHLAAASTAGADTGGPFLSIFFGDGTEDHPNGGPHHRQRLFLDGRNLLWRNGLQGWQRRNLRQRRRWLQRRKRRLGRLVRGTAETVALVSPTETAETVARRPDIRRWRYGRRGRERINTAANGGNGGSAGLFGNGGKGGAGGVADVNRKNKKQMQPGHRRPRRHGRAVVRQRRQWRRRRQFDSRRRHRRHWRPGRCHRPAFDMGGKRQRWSWWSRQLRRPGRRRRQRRIVLGIRQRRLRRQAGPARPGPDRSWR